jgi:hypothetical protein
LRARYILSAVCVFLFLTAQTFQEIASRFWIPAPRAPQDELLVYLLPIDQARSILVMGTIVALIVPFAVIALRYRRRTPLASILGFIFGAAFIGFELSYRSLDFFVIGQRWAHELASASGPQRELVLERFARWNEMVRGWYFPLMLSYLLASCAFAVAAWTDRQRGRWYYFAPIAYALNALRLLGRILSWFAGQHWLDGFNDKLYFPIVFVINAMVLIWFLVIANEPTGTNEAPTPGTRPLS